MRKKSAFENCMPCESTSPTGCPPHSNTTGLTTKTSPLRTPVSHAFAPVIETGTTCVAEL